MMPYGHWLPFHLLRLMLRRVFIRVNKTALPNPRESRFVLIFALNFLHPPCSYIFRTRTKIQSKEVPMVLKFGCISAASSREVA